MGKFTVDLQALLGAVDQMSRFDTELEQQLNRVRASADSLGLTWHGDAADQQRVAQDQWNSGADELRAALGQLRDIAERAHTNYSGAVANNTRMWQ
jgi:WXG100 family type VII secretion target